MLINGHIYDLLFYFLASQFRFSTLATRSFHSSWSALLFARPLIIAASFSVRIVTSAECVDQKDSRMQHTTHEPTITNAAFSSSSRERYNTITANAIFL